jgi:hypothetical protein
LQVATQVAEQPAEQLAEQLPGDSEELQPQNSD